jgi:hypothetical protein
LPSCVTTRPPPSYFPGVSNQRVSAENLVRVPSPAAANLSLRNVRPGDLKWLVSKGHLGVDTNQELGNIDGLDDIRIGMLDHPVIIWDVDRAKGEAQVLLVGLPPNVSTYCERSAANYLF